MAEELEPSIRVEVNRFAQDRRMIEAVKFLRGQGFDPRTSKDLVEAAFKEIYPDEAHSRQTNLDNLQRELEAKKE